ncbi:beta-galactosidase trimerization domain-containing protein [Solwaraspora sp. WMMD791]|uniref:beta-galactosidase trimerization domain-containing protein n=1 Tax=Solwaraspora sp. WMMD791 TaxID=3016086 RepID=UPI00249B1D54|nr:beta-galactosidase trimerization domain-containing protein [Solwaraspora sp. WMMD791]WFE28729.1 beta-galactosidase trimerization domain-containing protein [Solwaraspora sp. WMMD791]
MSSRFEIRDGQLWCDGAPFSVAGVDYHPSVAGCRIWTDWDPSVLRRDFRAMADVGLNTVRIFLFWRDFEPVPGHHDPVVLDRLRTAVDLAADAGLACVLSLLTIWMNGQRLDLSWRQGRSLFADAEMLDRQRAYARRVAIALRGAGNLLAVDLGDEVANVDRPAGQLDRETVSAWQTRLAATLREELPGLLVTQANDASGVLGAAPFGPDNAVGLDLIALHGFPTWAPVSIESTSCYKASNLVPFLVRYARAFGVPLVDELASYGTDEATAAAYLRAATASAVGNGAAGVIAWCWQDIASTSEPYQQRPGERYVGLHRLDGTARPALTALREALRAAPRLRPAPGRAPVALYLPQRVRVDGGSYLDTGVGTVATFYAYLLLKRAHLPVDIVADDPTGYRLVICPSVGHVTLTDLDRLSRAAGQGATVYYSMADHLHGFPGAELAGVELVDYTLLPDGHDLVEWGTDQWPVDWTGTGIRPSVLAATTGQVLGRYPDGTPALVRNRVGAGQVVFCAAPFERQLDQPGRLTAAAWEGLYRRVAALAGLAPEVDCADPDVEVLPGRAADSDEVLLINHAPTARRVQLRWRTPAGQPVCQETVLDGKDWRLVTPPTSASAARPGPATHGSHGRRPAAS